MFFCQLNFIVLFPFFIKYYHILFIIIIIIVFWLGCYRPWGLLFFFVPASLLVFFFCFFILLHSCCSHAQVFGKTLAHEFPISYSHTEWYFLFFLFGAEKPNMPSGRYYRHCANRLIKNKVQAGFLQRLEDKVWLPNVWQLCYCGGSKIRCDSLMCGNCVTAEARR